MISKRASGAVPIPAARSLALAGALLVLLAACMPQATGDEASVQAASMPIVAYQGEQQLGAQELDFTELLGQGIPVVLNFWAGLCPPCRAEMPSFQRVYDRHAGDFLLVGVDVGPFIGLGSHADARALLAELGITYPTAYAVESAAVIDYNIVNMPTTVFYAADGTEQRRHPGLMTEQMFEEAVQQVIAAGR